MTPNNNFQSGQLEKQVRRFAEDTLTGNSMFNCCGSKTSATTLHLNITFFASSYFLYKVARRKSPYDADGWKTVPEGLTQFKKKKKKLSAVEKELED